MATFPQFPSPERFFCQVVLGILPSVPDIRPLARYTKIRHDMETSGACLFSFSWTLHPSHVVLQLPKNWGDVAAFCVSIHFLTGRAALTNICLFRHDGNLCKGSNCYRRALIGPRINCCWTVLDCDMPIYRGPATKGPLAIIIKASLGRIS